MQQAYLGRHLHAVPHQFAALQSQLAANQTLAHQFSAPLPSALQAPDQALPADESAHQFLDQTVQPQDF